MHRIDNATAATTLPVQKPPGTPGFWSGGNPQVGQQATIVDQDFMNALQEELAHCVEGAGIVLNKADTYQLLQAIRAYGRISPPGGIVYVDSTSGNDSNNGQSGSPFRSLQRAFDFVSANVDARGDPVTIQLADGTYGAGSLQNIVPGTGLGLLNLRGNPQNPQNVLIDSTTQPTIYLSNCNLQIDGVSLENHAPANLGACCIEARGTSQVQLFTMRYGPAQTQHILAYDSTYVFIEGNYTIYGPSSCHIASVQGSQVIGSSYTCTIAAGGAGSYSSGFLSAANAGVFQMHGATFSGPGLAGVTGPRFNLVMLSQLDVGPGRAANTVIPGNQNGFMSFGSVASDGT